MARLSKTQPFAIYEDGHIPASDATEQVPLDVTHSVEDRLDIAAEELKLVSKILSESPEDKIFDLEIVPEGDASDADDERRESVLTTASISSLPESAYETDNDIPNFERLATANTTRPSFRKVGPVKQTQILTPPRFAARSPRQSRSRGGTPKSLLSTNIRGSPRSRHRISEATEGPEEQEKHYPLVLLHATLLSVNLPWSAQSMQEILPKNVLDNLKLLKSKISETVSSRGILIPHPREEYDLLEEKLLEALELVDERVTKDGHFHSRHSSSSGSESGLDSDSGMGSSTTGSDGGLCTTCRHRVKTSGKAVGDGNKKWSLKIFAANGLLRPSAWAAAWPDMESVDVEILPWISEDFKRQLDERKAREEADEGLERQKEEDERKRKLREQADEAIEKQEEEDERIRRIVEEQVFFALEEQKRSYEAAAEAFEEPVYFTPPEPSPSMDDSARDYMPAPCFEETSPEPDWNDLPQIYRPSEIPLSVLLKNYVYILSKDWRNVAIFLLGILALWTTLTRGNFWSSSLDLPGERISHFEAPLLERIPLPEIETGVNISIEPSVVDPIDSLLSTEIVATPPPDSLDEFDFHDEVCEASSKHSRSIFQPAGTCSAALLTHLTDELHVDEGLL